MKMFLVILQPQVDLGLINGKTVNSSRLGLLFWPGALLLLFLITIVAQGFVVLGDHVFFFFNFNAKDRVHLNGAPFNACCTASLSQVRPALIVVAFGLFNNRKFSFVLAIQMSDFRHV